MPAEEWNASTFGAELTSEIVAVRKLAELAAAIVAIRDADPDHAAWHARPRVEFPPDTTLSDDAIVVIRAVARLVELPVRGIPPTAPGRTSFSARLLRHHPCWIAMYRAECSARSRTELLLRHAERVSTRYSWQQPQELILPYMDRLILEQAMRPAEHNDQRTVRERLRRIDATRLRRFAPSAFQAYTEFVILSHWALGDHEDASHIADEALSYSLRAPDFIPLCHAGCARVIVSTTDQEAYAAASKAISELRNRSQFGHLSLWHVCVRILALALGRADAAFRLCDTLAARATADYNPITRASHLALRGLCYHVRGDADAACSDAEMAISVSGHAFSFLDDILFAHLLLAVHKPAKVDVEYLEQLLSTPRGPSEAARIHTSLAIAYATVGSIDQRIRHVDAVIRLAAFRPSSEVVVLLDMIESRSQGLGRDLRDLLRSMKGAAMEELLRFRSSLITVSTSELFKAADEETARSATDLVHSLERINELLTEANTTLLTTTTQLAAARQQAERSAEHTRLILRSLAHDVRSPLAGIALHAEGALVSHNSRATLSQTLQEIADASRSLYASVDAILARDRPAPVEINVKADAATIVRDMLQLHRALLTERRLDLIDDMPEHILVSAEPAYLRSIFGNIVSNAVRHSLAPGGWIRVSAETTDATQTIMVRNRGQALPESSIRLIEAIANDPDHPVDVQLARGLALIALFCRLAQATLRVACDRGVVSFMVTFRNHNVGELS